MESKELLAEILSLAASALEKFADEKQAAAHIKKTLDGRPAPGDVWHVIMGRTFGGYCQYAKGHYVYFYIGQVCPGAISRIIPDHAVMLRLALLFESY